MKRSSLAVGVTALLAGAGLLTPASAAPAVSITAVQVADGAATVSGTATFDGAQSAESVGGTVVNGTAPAQVFDAAGIQLTGARIEPLADRSGLRFIWDLKSMPAQVPPEGVRYLWAFQAGASTYQLQAKRTNLGSVSTTEDPVGHVEQVPKGDFFQLRGACVAEYKGAPINGCHHLGFFRGSFDVAGKRVTFDLPFRARDAIGRVVAEEFKPGAVLTPILSGGSSVAGSFQAVVSTAAVTTAINDWGPYHVGGSVRLGTGPADLDPSEVDFATPASLTGTTFTGTVPVATGDSVYARACSGMTCSTTSAPAGS